MKAARADVNKQCHFGYALIKADALLLKLGVLHELLMDAEAEIAALKSFYENLGGVLCEDCRPEVEHYIKDKEEQVDELLVILKKDLETGKNLLKDLGE